MECDTVERLEKYQTLSANYYEMLIFLFFHVTFFIRAPILIYTLGFKYFSFRIIDRSKIKNWFMEMVESMFKLVFASFVKTSKIIMWRLTYFECLCYGWISQNPFQKYKIRFVGSICFIHFRALKCLWEIKRNFFHQFIISNIWNELWMK